MANFNSAAKESQGEPSAVGQTGNVNRSSSMTGSAAKVFREFKWGLLTLFLLMVVVIGLVYDGGRKKKDVAAPVKVAEASPDINLDGDPSMPMGGIDPSVPVAPAPQGPVVPNQQNTNQNFTDSAPPLPPAPADRQPEHLTQTPPSHDLGTPHGPREVVTAPDRTDRPGRRVETALPETHRPAAPVPAPAPAPASDKTYTVKAGDTLTRIASTVLPGNKGAMKALLEANKDVLPNPNKLKVGMTLKVPTVSAAPAAPAKSGEGKKLPKIAELSMDAPAPDSGKTEKKEVKLKDAGTKEDYVVQSGDTLERIARKLFNDGKRWKDIYEWNRDQLPDPGRLRLGQTLRIKTLSASKSGTSASHAEAEPKEEKATDVKEPKESKANKRVAAVEPSSEEPHVDVMSSRVMINDLP